MSTETTKPAIVKTQLSDVQLGNKVRNRVSGFEGTVLLKARYLTGSDQVLIQGTYNVEKGFTPTESTDVQVIEIIDKHLADLATPGDFPEHIKLGIRAKDKISGMTGVIACLVEHFNGCHQAHVKPDHKDNDGKILPAIQIDVAQIDVIPEETPVMTRDANAPRKGGPQDELLMHTDPIQLN